MDAQERERVRGRLVDYFATDGLELALRAIDALDAAEAECDAARAEAERYRDALELADALVAALDRQDRERAGSIWDSFELEEAVRWAKADYRRSRAALATTEPEAPDARP